MSHSLLRVGRSCTPPTYTGMEANLHRRCNVQCTEAGAWKTACFVDLDPETTPLAAAAWRSLLTWRRRFLVLGEGRDWWGTEAETHSESQTQVDGRRHGRGWKPDTVCLADPGRAATTVCLLLEGFPMGSHLSKSHATCKAPATSRMVVKAPWPAEPCRLSRGLCADHFFPAPFSPGPSPFSQAVQVA
jgi:hypothetical protein